MFRLFAAFAITLWSLPASAASTSALFFESFLPTSFAPFGPRSGTFSGTGFDPNLGTLTSIDFDPFFNGSFSAGGATTAADFGGTVDYDIRIEYGPSLAPWYEIGAAAIGENVGFSGQTSFSAQIPQVFADPATFAALTGTGPGDVVTFDARMSASATYSSSILFPESIQFGFAGANVTYNYTPTAIPLPASWAFAALGLGALGAVSRRKSLTRRA